MVGRRFPPSRNSLAVHARLFHSHRLRRWGLLPFPISVPPPLPGLFFIPVQERSGASVGDRPFKPSLGMPSFLFFSICPLSSFLDELDSFIIDLLQTPFRVLPIRPGRPQLPVFLRQAEILWSSMAPPRQSRPTKRTVPCFSASSRLRSPMGVGVLDLLKTHLPRICVLKLSFFSLFVSSSPACAFPNPLLQRRVLQSPPFFQEITLCL